MRILFLTQVLPFPPDSGPKIKTLNVLRYLAQAGHTVTLCSFIRSEAEKESLSLLEPYCRGGIYTVLLHRSRGADLRYLIQSLFSQVPFLIRRDFSREMCALVQSLDAIPQDRRYDVIHADQLNMGQYALAAHSAGRCGTNPALVLDDHNAVWTIVARAVESAPFFLRPFLNLEAQRLESYEGSLCCRMDAVLAVSQIDKQALVQAGADPDRITVIPIAVDAANAVQVPRPEHSAEILTVSTLFYPPNADGVRWFIKEVYPLIRFRVPESTLTIVGPRPPQDIIEFGKKNPGHVRVTGYVADLRPYLARAAVMVVPLRSASGMRVRILEALAEGIPLVTTSIGVEGIDAVDGVHVLVANQAEVFAERVAQLLGDRELAARLAQNGRHLVEEKYDWQTVLPQLGQIYKSINSF